MGVQNGGEDCSNKEDLRLEFYCWKQNPRKLSGSHVGNLLSLNSQPGVLAKMPFSVNCRHWAHLNKQGVSKQRVTTFAWRPGSQHDVAATRGADNVMASACRAPFGCPSTRTGCRICVTVRLPVRPRGETVYSQANANTPLFC